MIDCKMTKNYFQEKARMTKADKINCSILCVDCPLSQYNNHEEMVCHNFELRNSDKAIAIVQKWSDEHTQKTYKDDFFEKFPNAPTEADGAPRCCRSNIYGSKEKCDIVNFAECHKCWNEVMTE